MWSRRYSYHPDGSRPQDLFNRTFNNPDVLGGQPAYSFNPPRILLPNDPADPNRGWLRAALEISDAELDMLLAGPPAAPLVLSKPVISQLYRLSQLPKILHLWTHDFLELLKLLSINVLDQLRNFDVLEKVIDAAQWMRGSGFNVHELQALRHKSSNPFVSLTDAEVDVRLLCEDLAADLANSTLLETDLTAVEGVTPRLASVLFDNLVRNGFVAPANNSDRQGRLTIRFQPAAAGFTLQPLAAPFDTAAAEQRLIQALAARDPQQIVLNRLGLFLGIEPALVSNLVVASGNALDDANLFGWLTRPIDSATPIPQGLSVFLAAMRAYQLLLREVELESDEIAHIAANPPYYNIDNLGNLSFANVRRLKRFAQLAGSLNARTALRGVFDGGDRAAKIGTLASLLHHDAAEVTAVVDAGWPVQPALSDTRFANAGDIASIKERLDLASCLGVDVRTMMGWAAWNDGGWNEYQRIADSVLETLKAKYSERDWSKMYDPLHDDVRERMRDALASFVMARERGRGITNLNDLYKFFLIDLSCEWEPTRRRSS